MPEAAAAASSSVAAAADRDDESGVYTLIQRWLFDYYHLIAYFLVILTYFLAFGVFLYLRLVSIIIGTRVNYRRTCQRLQNESIVRNELHYASATLAFLAVGAFQIVCFFLLTISSRWLTVRRTYRQFMSLEEKLKQEMVISIQRVMFVTVLPTFLVYFMCSTVLLCAIFYMVGMRDPVQSTIAQVLIYVFDASVGVYLLAFPLVCLIYHPRLQLRLCWRQIVGVRRSGGGGVTDDCRGSLPPRALSYISSTSGGAPAAHLVAYRRREADARRSTTPEIGPPRQLRITRNSPSRSARAAHMPPPPHIPPTRTQTTV